jgi:hypothetical protein
MTPAHVTRHAPWVAAALLAATALLAPVWPEAHISTTSGHVELGRGEPPVWKPAASGDALAPGDRVRTGESGRAELALGDSTLRLYPNSLLRLPAPGPDAAAVELDGGSSLFDVLRRGEPFEVRTPEVVVSVKGTRFAVDVGTDDASVSVFRGLVGVRDGTLDAASEILVQEGFAAIGGDQLELTWHGADDPWDGWSRGEPMRDLDPGRDAALRDARAAALELARKLPHPAARAPEGEHEGDRQSPDAELPQNEPQGEIPRDRLQKADPKLDQELERSFVENVVNGLMSSTDPNGGLLQIVFLDGSGQSGPDLIQIVTDQDTWTFQESDVEEVLEGTAALPPNLLTLIEAQGLTDTELANQLLRLFD